MKPKFLTNREAQKRIAELEALVTKGAPVTNAAPDPGKAAAAVKARLDSAKAALAAAEAKAVAKSAAAALKPAASVATMTAEQWQAQNAPPTMTRAEWQKLSHGDRSKFFQTGGALAP